ncbi:trichohyalin [Epinephelus moara]|uniref:trichohyalin n=1 Tax=Epinephelus moara TaxID=300413 RepID=UPI00214F036C|nr:trichohyalin [Epinephelus moara]
MSLADQQQWCPTSVQVTVQQARGLRTKGKSGTNDAYALMQVGKEKFQTSVVEKCVAPVWKEEAAFDLPGGGGGGGGGTERCVLHVHVLHRALVGPDKLLGQAVINLLQLSEDKTRNKTEWFKLLDKTGKADKDRGEVLVNIQFMRNNMTASMFDLSAAGKSRSRLGKFKDKVRGKKKESDTASNVVPSLTQVLTDSEGEENGDGEVAEGKDEKKKKHKMKSLFSPKSNLQKNMSQSMSVLPAKNSSLSGSQSSGLNVDSSEGKKKFKFKIHKRSGSSGNKDSPSGHQKQGTVEQSNLCINGSHVYCEEPPPRTSRIGSNFSIASSGHGSMEEVPESSPPSVDSLRGVRQYSPWTEEEEENIKEDVGELRGEEEETIMMEEERRRKEEEEERARRQEEELAEEKRRQEEQEEKVRKEEEERIRMEEEERALEEKRRQEEKERVRIEELERERLAEEKRRQEEQERRRIEEEERAQEERRRQEEEERLRREEEERERLREEKRKQEEQEKRRIEEVKRQREEEERAQEERRRQEEDERLRREEEERERLREEKKRLEEQERRRIEEEKMQREEEERAQEEMRRQEEEERLRREEEERERLEKEKRRLEEQEKRQREEEERIRMEEERAQEERRRQELKLAEEKRRQEEEKRREEEERAEEEKRRREEEMMRRQEEEREEKRRLEEQERRRREEEERIKKEEEERARREKEEFERLVEEKRKQEEEERKRIEAEEKIRREEEERIRLEEERRRKEEEERERLAEEKRKLEEQERRRTEEEEKRRREEEERIRKEEERRQEEEERARKEKEEHERLIEEKKRQDEQERKRMEEEERVRREKEAEKEKREEEARKLEKEKSAKDAGEQKKKENKTKPKAPGRKPNVAERSPAGVTSTNPFDEDFSDPSEEILESPDGPDSSTAKVSTAQQRIQSAASSVRSNPVSTDEKDPISTQREKRPAPRPPGSNQAERQSQREQDASTRHLAQINKQSKDKDVKTVSVLPQRLVQMIAPLSRSPTDAKNTQSLTQSSTTRGTSNAAKHNKRPAPSRPRSAEEEPPSEHKTAPSSDGNISNECASEAKQAPIVYGLNPFEDDEDENAAQDDTTSSGNTASVQWPPAVSQAADEDAASHAKIKSSKIRAPPVPALKAATLSTSVEQNTDGGHVTDETGVTETDNSSHDPETVNPVPDQEVSPQESQPATVQSAGEEAGGKKEGPPVASRRLQPVKPLNPLEQRSVSAVQGEKENKSTEILCEVQEKTKVNGTELKGPFSQLTQEELISLVIKQETQLADRDKKITELEQYIDNLLVRVMEENPTILMSLNAMK